MSSSDWLRSGRLQYLTLWTLAVISVGFALTDTGLLGFDPPMLAVLGAVFAASTATYRRRSRCSAA